MSAIAPNRPAPRPRAALHRWIRRIHLWIGAWGALAAVLYGTTGLIMSHRFGDNAWPQGDSAETGRTTLAVPATARTSAEALSLWLREAHGLDAQTIRKPKPGGEGGPRRSEGRGPSGWSLSGGTASASWSLDYAPGADTAELKRTRHSPLAAFTRLHKAVAGGDGWRLLGDSFAIGMILLGLSGLLLWARGRTPKQMLVSVFGASLFATLLVLIPNLL
ncbi:MAG: PepSY-associated TM helix domain-containing protein [Xanthomonadales bacterium]|nr:PepSY-associated TM helix domain-containing protein [Xanthomonadales bacterium]